MSPEPLDPAKAMQDAITSLEEQVQHARDCCRKRPQVPEQRASGDADMPNGPSIFETNGAWEDFSTPARDLRLLIAIDVVHGFPDHVARRADRYAIPRAEVPPT